jgi:hypothetical protein
MNFYTFQPKPYTYNCRSFKTWNSWKVLLVHRWLGALILYNSGLVAPKLAKIISPSQNLVVTDYGISGYFEPWAWTMNKDCWEWMVIYFMSHGLQQRLVPRYHALLPYLRPRSRPPEWQNAMPWKMPWPAATAYCTMGASGPGTGSLIYYNHTAHRHLVRGWAAGVVYCGGQGGGMWGAGWTMGEGDWHRASTV